MLKVGILTISVYTDRKDVVKIKRENIDCLAHGLTHININYYHHSGILMEKRTEIDSIGNN